MSCSRFVLLASVVAVLSSSSRVLAQEPPVAAADACASKQAGEACVYVTPVKVDGEVREQATPGVCQADRCCELEYTEAGPPTPHCSPCLTCKAGPASEPNTATPSEASNPPADERSPAGQDPPVSAGNGQRGCAIAGDRTAAALLFLLIGFSRTLVRRRD